MGVSGGGRKNEKKEDVGKGNEEGPPEMELETLIINNSLKFTA